MTVEALAAPSVAAREDTFLPAARVRERYDISDMSLWRWERDPELGFPAPTRINNRRYWKLGDLVAWEQSRAARREVA